MARTPRSRDWQERAFEETELKRQDQKSGTASDAATASTTPDPLKPTTDFKRRSSWRVTALAVVLVIAALLFRVHQDNDPPALTTSCTTPAFALSTTAPSASTTVRWAATGPASMHFIIAIGIERLVSTGQAGHLHAVPQTGHSATTAEEAVPTAAMPSSCKANGAFPIEVPKGTYLIRMFRVEGTGTAVTGTAVATKTLTVS